jgi:hypothetical protein
MNSKKKVKKIALFTSPENYFLVFYFFISAHGKNNVNGLNYTTSVGLTRAQYFVPYN